MRLSRPDLMLVLAAALLALFPLTDSTFYIQLVTKIMIMSIFALSLDLLVGYTGLISFGHAAYFGLAGYALALMTPKYEAVALWWTLPAAMAVVGAVRAADWAAGAAHPRHLLPHGDAGLRPDAVLHLP